MSRDAGAVPVEYVRICTVYGAGFNYVPGTDTCFNATTNEARQATEGGTWRWRMPNNPHTWASRPEDACKGGRVLKVGDFSGANLTPNAYGRYESTAPLALSLKTGQFISAVMYQGGLASPQSYPVAELPACPSDNAVVFDATDASCTAGGVPVGGGATACEVTCNGTAWQFTGNSSIGNLRQGTFCLYYRYADATSGDPVHGFPLGCLDTAAQRDVPATRVFTPERPIPPATTQPVSLVGVAAEAWGAPTVVQGTLSVSVCVQRVKPSKRGR